MQRGLLIFFTAFFYLCAITAQAQDTISIQGTLLMLDDKTPHVAVPVEAIRNGEVVDLVLSDENGEYQFVNLESGRYQMRCQVLGGYIYYQATSEPLRVTPYEEAPATESDTRENVGEILYVRSGKGLMDIDLRFRPFKKGTWRSYTRLEGLADDSVLGIQSDLDGVMWIATDGGVSSYDGKEFTNFTTEDGLQGNQIFAVYRASDGMMWFGTRSGVSRYDGSQFVNFTKKDGFSEKRCRVIYQEPNGVMWFGTSGDGVFRYDGRVFVNFTTEDGLAHNYVRAIHRDPDGMMWFGTWGGGISRYDGKIFVNFTTKDGLAHNTVGVIYSASDGVVWFGTWGGGISRYDGQDFVNLTTEDGLAHNIVSAIYRASDGAMWIGTNDGVSRYDGQGFINFTIHDGLAGNYVNAIHVDPNGTIWFATEFKGISKYDAKTFVSFDTEDGLLSDSVRSAHRTSDGTLWFGTREGVSRYDGEEFINFTAKDGAGWTNYINSMPDGILWLTGGGVSRYDGETFVKFTTEDGLVDNDAWAISRSSDGAMWFGTRGGVSRYDGEEFINYTTEDGLVNDWIRSIYIAPDDALWIGTYGGLSRYNGEEFVNFTKKDGLADDRVYAIHPGIDGLLWFGTNNGISCYDGQEFVVLPDRDRLAHIRVECIRSSPDGIMWFSTGGNGVFLHDGIAWSSLDTRDGLAGNWVRSILLDEDGHLWVGADGGGVTRYRRDTVPPQVRIRSVLLEKQRYTDLSAIPAITVRHNATIEYSAIDFKTLPEKRQYRYRIKELDSDWRSPTNAEQFEWTPEKTGTYTFEVQAIDRDLNYSEPASLAVRIIPPPFYTRTGFIIGTILAAFLIPTIIYAILLTRQRKQEFEPIQNPYIVGNPIRSKDMFFGRKSDFEFIRIKLSTEEAGLVIVFAGERRSGKTSILFQILEGELGERIMPVLLDMQAMAVDNEGEFFEKLASEISEAFVGAGLKPPDANFREGNAIRAFEGYISQAMETLEGRGLLLLFDEYELIESKIDDGSLRPEIITFFASLLEAHPRLSFIFTGSRHLEGRNISYWRVLIGKSLYRRISFLSERDALRLITEPVADRVIYPRGIPERIIRLTAGQPFYTQVMCQNMMDRLNEVERNRVRQEDVDAVAQELADNPLPQMIYFWDGLEQEKKGALSLLGEVLENSDRYASAQILINFAQEQKLELEIESSDLERVLDDLFVNDVLERERSGEGKYEYRFRVDLFRLWARQAHSVWQQVG